MQDLNPGTYNGPTIIADEMDKCFPENRDTLKIIDIACGTGRVGKEVNILSPYLILNLNKGSVFNVALCTIEDKWNQSCNIF